MDDELFNRGLAIRNEVVGDATLRGASDFDRPMHEMVTKYVWGDIWARPGLDRQFRSILNIGMLAAMNRPEELATHIKGALANGLTEEQIQEALLQVALYCGMSSGLCAFRVARKVMEERHAQA
jgi:4-carboxymuconolactone decarboxylase